MAKNLTFKQLVHPDLVRGLQTLSISAPNSIQAKAIPLGLSGRDVLVCAQTGSGKTFTFILPILQRLLTETEPTTAVIVAPTDQLAHQVAAVAERLVSSCQKRYKKNARPIELYSKDLDRPVDATGGRHLFVGTPTFVSKHMPSKIHMLAIDEADLLLCESQVHESYLDLANQRCAAEELLRAARSMDSQLFLAMAHLTDQREEELLARFPSMQQVSHTGVLVPTLRQCFHYFKGDEDAKTAKLLWILAEAEKEELECVNGATLIFAASPAKVEHLQVLLASEKPGFKILSLHEKSGNVQEVSECFRSGTAQVLIATDMSVRGLDFPLVRHVILYDLPVDATAFVHCAGRTARSGNTGLVTCIVEAGDARQGHFDGKAIHSLTDGPQLSFDYKISIN